MQDRQERLKQVAQIAVLLEAQTGCPAPMLIAQWALESRWGEKPVGHANYFGVKKAARHQKRCTVATHGNGGSDPVLLDASQIAIGIFSPARIPQIAYASLSGIPSTFNAGQLVGRAVDNAVPGDNDVLTYNLAAAKWTPKAPSGGLSGGIAAQLALWKDGTSLQSSGLLVHKNLSGTDVLNFASSPGSYIQWGKVQGLMTQTSLLEFYPDPSGAGLTSLMFCKANGSQQAKIYYDYDGQWKMTGFVNQTIRITPNYGVGGSGSGAWNWPICSTGDGACNGIVTMVPYCRFFDPSTAPGGTLSFTLNWTDERNQAQELLDSAGSVQRRQQRIWVGAHLCQQHKWRIVFGGVHRWQYRLLALAV